MCGITDGEGAALGDVSAGCVMCGITDGEGAGVGDGVSAGCVVCGVADGDGAGFGGGLCPSCCAITLGAPQKIITETTIAFRLLFMIDRLVMGAPKKLGAPDLLVDYPCLFVSISCFSFILVSHESAPQQQHPPSAEWFFALWSASCFIAHEPPLQQHEDMPAQHDSLLLLASFCVVVCAKPILEIASDRPMTRPAKKPL